MKTQFSDAYIKGLKPKAAPYKITENARRGEGRLIVRVQPSGIKEFFYRYRTGGLDRTVALGRYDAKGANGKTLAKINAELRKKRDLQRETGDLKLYEREEAEKQAIQARLREIERRKGSLRQLLDAYVENLRSAGKPSVKQAEGIFTRHVIKPFPVLADTKANEIKPSDIQAILARMVKRGITRQVNILRSYLHAAYTYGGKADNDPRTMARDGVLFGLTSNPVALVPRIAEFEKAGDRVLTDEELREYWEALETLPLPQCAFLRFNLALGGQRIIQLLRASWEDFDLDAETVLLRDSKGRGGVRDHLVPLTPFALEQLEPLRQLNADAVGPFTSDGKRAMVTETLSIAVRQISEKLTEQKSIPVFQLRDLRRTCETMLAAIGIDKETRAHILSHGRTSGVQAKHYDRYTYLPEKRAALEKWAEKLQRVLDPGRSAKVVKIRR